MNFLFALTVCAIVMTAVVDGQATENDWRMYKNKFKKNYFISADGGKLDKIHKQIFFQRFDKIQKQNSNPLANYRRELTYFSDLLPKEFQRYLGINPTVIPTSKKDAVSLIPEGVDMTDLGIPATLDYRYDPCLPDIKNQGKCASSWDFSAMTPVEFAYCRKNNNISVPLSEQQLIDCDRSGFNTACWNGWPSKGLDYMMAKGVTTAKKYPYKYTGGPCRYTASMKVTSVASYEYIDPGSVVDIKYALTKLGPLSAAMAVTDSFADYGGGVYDSSDCDGKSPNHAVVLVGWGTLNGVDYWIGRNSWGTGWGKSGYFLIQRGANKCKIESYTVFVKVA